MYFEVGFKVNPKASKSLQTPSLSETTPNLTGKRQILEKPLKIKIKKECKFVLLEVSLDDFGCYYCGAMHRIWQNVKQI